MDKTKTKKTSMKNATMPLGALAVLLGGLLLSPAAAADPDCPGSGSIFGQAQDCITFATDEAQWAIGVARDRADAAVAALGATVDEQRQDAQAAIDGLQLAIEAAVAALQDAIDRAVAEAQDNVTATQETLDEVAAAGQNAIAIVGGAADIVLLLGSDELGRREAQLQAAADEAQERFVDLLVLVGNLPAVVEGLPGLILGIVQQVLDIVFATVDLVTELAVSTYQATVAWARCTTVGPDGCTDPFPIET